MYDLQDEDLIHIYDARGTTDVQFISMSMKRQ